MNINKKKKYKMICLWLLLLVGLCLFPQCCSFVKIVKEIYNYNEYHYKQKPDIPDTFRLELPLILDRSTNYFCVQARINGQHEECFIIDTKADISLYKVDELKKIDSHYWGDFPIKSINSRNQRFYPKLYAFNNFEIASLSFGKSLFDAIDTLDAIYNIMNKNVIGVNIQKLVNWKFDLDNDKLVILGDDISNDTDGYTKIKKGLDWNKLDMSFPEAECSGSFTLDLGASSEVLVDKKLFEALKKIYSYKTVINKSNDTIYLFNNIAVKWYNVHISNCLVMHKPYFNRNIIGATFMRYFNFILNYRKPNKDVSYKDLYFKKVKDFDRIKPYTPFSEFGFNLEKKNDNVTIKSLEINGIAYKAGLKINDTIIGIDNGAFNLDSFNESYELFDFLSDKSSVTLQIERNEEIKEYILQKNN